MIPAGTNHVYPYPANGMTGAQLKVSPNCDPNNVVFWEFAQGNDISTLPHHSIVNHSYYSNQSDTLTPPVYYDVNTNSPQDPFSRRGLGVVGVNTSACPAISCAAGGSLACFNNPNGHQQNQVKACASSNSIDFNACRP